jgi:integrase
MNSKLFETTTREFRLPHFVDGQGRVHTAPADNVVIMRWPDGSPCWEANLYILRTGYWKGRSRLTGGGTLREIAKCLTALLRHCFANRIDPAAMTEAHFQLLVQGLLGERDPAHPELKRRKPARAITIGRRILRFLAFLQEEIYPGARILGESGAIKAELRTATVKRNGRTYKVVYWYHAALDIRVTQRERLPIAAADIERLHKANQEVEASTFLRRRRFIMLQLFEATGGRRVEISRIRVSDVVAAAESGMLTLFSAKRGDPSATREVPFSRSDVQVCLDFVRYYRQRIVRATVGESNDSGVLLIGETAGQPLAVDSLGNELALLRDRAGITSEACLHCFRHAYITNVFVWLIETHHFKNASDLKAAVLSTEELKTRLAEWTGHKDINSLTRYIHLAFAKVAKIGKVLEALALRRTLESTVAWLKDLQLEATKGMAAAMISTQIAGFVHSLEVELAAQVEQV